MMDELRKNYAAAFGGRLTFGARPALVLVDVAMAYLTEGSPLFDARFLDALASCTRLADACRTLGVPVIFTRVVYRANGADGGLFFRKVPALAAFVEGNKDSEFPAGLRPRDDEVVVTKQYASSFFGTSLAATLSAMRVDTLLIGGFSTSGCVRATALDALQSGFAPFVVADSCGDRHPGPHEANLFDLSQKYAEVVDEAKALDLLASRVAVSREA